MPIAIRILLEAGEGKRYKVEIVDYHLEARIRINNTRALVTLTPNEIRVRIEAGRLHALTAMIRDPSIRDALRQLACETRKKILVQLLAPLPAVRIECRKREKG